MAISRLSKYFPQIELRRLLTGRNFSGSWALRDVALELWPGETLCIVGPNGSGKTTLLKLIATLLIPTQGRILVQGHDTVRRPLAVKRHLGFITSNEESFYGRLTGWQNLVFFARLQNLDPEVAIPPVAQLLQLEPYLDRRFFSYSTGIKRRLDIARGLLHQPDILLLDEPTTNLDPISAMEVRDFLIQLRDQGNHPDHGDAPPGGSGQTGRAPGHHAEGPSSGSPPHSRGKPGRPVPADSGRREAWCCVKCRPSSSGIFWRR